MFPDDIFSAEEQSRQIEMKAYYTNERKRLEKVVEELSNHELFHHLWTKAVGTEGYSKREWLELEGRLYKIGFFEEKRK